VEEKKIPGFVFGATSVDEEIYFKAGGNNVVDDPSSGPVTEDTVFWICSQTKLLTHVRSNHLAPPI
jgi:CubicO group peptidase (beta-lactamase class C family)